MMYRMYERIRPELEARGWEVKPDLNCLGEGWVDIIKEGEDDMIVGIHGPHYSLSVAEGSLFCDAPDMIFTSMTKLMRYLDNSNSTV